MRGGVGCQHEREEHVVLALEREDAVDTGGRELTRSAGSVLEPPREEHIDLHASSRGTSNRS